MIVEDMFLKLRSYEWRTRNKVRLTLGPRRKR